jgi:hypothetical protein
VAIIHHGIIGKTVFDWRSSLTLQKLSELLKKYDFTLISQFSSWGEDEKYQVAQSDLISVFKKG